MKSSNLKKLAYSLGAIGTALSYQAFSTYIIFFYVDVIKLAVNLATIAIIFYGIWNAINDPLAGLLSDRTRSPWGRRIPYIAISAIPFGVIYYLLWQPPFRASEMIPLFLYFLAIICLFDLFYSVVVLNWASLFPEMFPFLKERAEVNTYRQSFGMVGLIVGMALPPILYSTIGWSRMGLIFGIIVALCFLISLLGSRERPELQKVKPLGFAAAVSATLKNRAFLIFVFSNLLIQYAFTVVLAIIPFFAKYVLKVGAGETSLLLFGTCLTAIFAMFMWRGAVVKFGAKNSYLTAILTLAAPLIALLFVHWYPLAVLFAALAGVGLAGTILIMDIIISDIIDDDETKTGCRREGIYFGINAFIVRFAIAMEALSAGGIFMLTGYNATLAIQPPQFFWGLRLLIGGLPVVALVFAFVIMLAYPLKSKL